MDEYNSQGIEQVIGLDVSDKTTTFEVVDYHSGEVVGRGKIATTGQAVKGFLTRPRARVVLETGTHSPWMSRQARECGHEVIVSNARKVALISANRQKDDPVDASLLARLGRADVQLLFPIYHRGREAQADLAVLRSRDALVRTRSALVSHARQTVKSFGYRLPACGTESFARRVRDGLPTELVPALKPLLMTIAQLTARIRQYDRALAQTAAAKYREETAAVRQVKGVGEVVGMGYVLTLEDPRRFRRSRQVGAYLGLVCGRDNSGETRRQLGITKQGDRLLRRLLIQSAHYILGPFGEDSDLQRFGRALYARGGQTKRAKRRATVAVARKLAALLHHLWVTGEKYEPLYQERRRQTRLAQEG